MSANALAVAVVLLAVVVALLSLVVFGPKIRERDARARANRRRREIEDAKWRELESCADWRAERHRKSTEAR
jgi:NhaP-type Na+/H+ or K+/H+ antiporter